MNELAPPVFAQLWRLARAQVPPPDPELALLQKYMIMHEDMHEHFDKLLDDPGYSLEVEGENLMLHIAMDAATEKSLASDEPAGVRDIMQSMLDAGVDPGVAFHAVANAMKHTFIEAASRGQDMTMEAFLQRALDYGRRACADRVRP